MAEKDISIRLALKDGETVRRTLMKLGDDGQNALAKIEKQSKPASKGLLAINAVSGELQGGISAMADRMGALGVGLGALGPAGLAAAAGIGASVAALSGLVRASVNAARELAAIKDEAQQAGAAVETYQALRYAAQEYSVSQDALTDGLKELNLRVDEWVTTGGGSAAEAFVRLGFAQDELQSKLGDTGELFLGVVQRMRTLESEAARIRVADEIFGGTGGEQFVRMVSAGESAIRSLMDEARNLGYVLDEHMIERADEARDSMAQLQRLIDVSLNSALLELVPIAEMAAKAFAVVARGVAAVADGFRDIENISTRGLGRRLADIQGELSLLFIKRRIAATDFARGNIDEQIQAYYDEIQKINLQLNARKDLRTPSVGGAGGQTGAAQKEAGRIQKVTDALRFQLDQLNRTEHGKRLFQELQRAGIDGNHKEAQSIKRLVFALHEQEKAAKAKKDGNAITKSVMTAAEKQRKAINEVNRLLAAGAITEETATRARQEATHSFEDAQQQRLRAAREGSDGIKYALIDLQDASANTAQQWKDDILGMNQAAQSAFVDIVTGAKSMSDGLSSILNDMLGRFMGRAYDRTVGSLFSTILDGVFKEKHDGGVVGEPSRQRQVSPLAFAGAPHLHSGGMVPGLRPGETPIIAMRGERVLTEAQQDNTARTIAGLAALSRPSSPGVNVVVNNNAAQVAQARAQVSQGQNGGLSLEIIVEEIENRIARNVFRGEGMAVTLENRYGLNPAAGARR